MAAHFQDRVAIITGGASGIGKALAQVMVQRGCAVVLAGRSEPKLAATEAELRASGAKVQRAVVDVRDRAAVEVLVNRVAQEHGHLDFMVNNAGISLFGEAQDYDWDAWQQVLDVNLMGVVHGVFAAYPVMIRQGSGHIVNVASLAGLVPTAGAVSYSAAKSGVVGLSQALRPEAARHGVRVSVVCPAAVWTPVIDNARYLNLDKEDVIKAAPGGRSTPEQCAADIVRGLEANRAVIAPATSKWLWRVHRYAPALTELMNGKIAQLVAKLRAERLASK